MPDRRQTPDRRRAGGDLERPRDPDRPGRRATDHSVPLSELANLTGMSSDFFLGEITAGELKAVKFGREWRVPTAETCRYLQTKGWPLPPWLESLFALAHGDRRKRDPAKAPV